MRRLDVPTIAGLLLFLVGIGLVIDSGLISGGVSASLADYIGVLALLGALLVVRVGLLADRSSPEPPTTETKAELPVPGTEVDELLAKIDANPLDRLEENAELRERLRTIAAALFSDMYGVREAAATEALAAGTWTDDPHAAAFFMGEYPEWAPLRLRLRDRATFTRTPPSMQAEHVVSELLAVVNGDHDHLHQAPVADGADSAADGQAVADAPLETQPEPDGGVDG